MRLTVLWARKVGAPDYTEELLTENQDRLEDARAWAESNGYVVREAVVDLSVIPNFAAVVKN